MTKKQNEPGQDVAERESAPAPIDPVARIATLERRVDTLVSLFREIAACPAIPANVSEQIFRDCNGCG